MDIQQWIRERCDGVRNPLTHGIDQTQGSNSTFTFYTKNAAEVLHGWRIWMLDWRLILALFIKEWVLENDLISKSISVTKD